MIWLIPFYAVPSIVEAWTDRNGEDRKGKLRDAVILIVLALLLSIVVRYYLDVPILKSIALFLAWRLLIFDYLVTYLLIKNKVIVGHWFTYTGKTAKWDKLISKINPWVRLLIRIIIFGLAVYVWIKPF